MVEQMEAPVLALWGGADQGITLEMTKAFDDALARAGIDHRSISYPGAPHSFFDRKAADFAEASAAAWSETLSFIRAHSPKLGVSA
jgi:carboxymethylenebutenolidase